MLSRSCCGAPCLPGLSTGDSLRTLEVVAVQPALLAPGPQGAVHEFDVAGHPQAEFHYAVVFPYHRQDNTVTLVREYAQVGPLSAWRHGRLDPELGAIRLLHQQQSRPQSWPHLSLPPGPEQHGVVPAHRRLRPSQACQLRGVRSRRAERGGAPGGRRLGLAHARRPPGHPGGQVVQVRPWLPGRQPCVAPGLPVLAVMCLLHHTECAALRPSLDRNRFHAYLVLDPQPDAQPGARDKEEYIQACLPGVDWGWCGGR